MSPTPLQPVGALDLLDLDAINDYHGRDHLPYPFMITQPSRFTTQDEAAAYATTVPDRLNHGNLKSFFEYVTTYPIADIRVEFRVQYIPADTPSVRIMAHREGERGFFGAQRADADVVDVYTLSPYDLGAAICDAVPFTAPGRHSRIVVPEYAPISRNVFDTGDFDVRDRVVLRSEVTIPASAVTAYATVQSHWYTSRNWGLDRAKQAAVWIRIHDDGEYIYAPDASCATPMTREVLHKRIDRLIGDDAVLVRRLRHR